MGFYFPPKFNFNSYILAKDTKNHKKHQKSFGIPKKQCIFAFLLKGKNTRGVAQLASAPGLGPGGPVFESLYPDNILKRLSKNYKILAVFFLLTQKTTS